MTLPFRLLLEAEAARRGLNVQHSPEFLALVREEYERRIAKREKQKQRAENLEKRAQRLADATAQAPPVRRKRRQPRHNRRQCGARCRDGHACTARVVDGRNRCRMHGGLSTGPKTPEGRAAIAASNRRRVQNNPTPPTETP